MSMLRPRMILTLLKGCSKVSEPRWMYYTSYILSHPQLHPYREVFYLFCPLKLWLYYLQGEEKHMKLSPQKHSPLRLLILVTLHFSHHFSEIRYVIEGGLPPKFVPLPESVRCNNFCQGDALLYTSLTCLFLLKFYLTGIASTLQPSAQADTNLLKFIIIIIISYRKGFISMLVDWY